MGKKVYTVNGKMYIIDDETGKVKTIEIKEEPIPQRDLDELIKLLVRQQIDD
jgi:predicted DNA-binding protein (MmcQ/YjbR family)